MVTDWRRALGSGTVSEYALASAAGSLSTTELLPSCMTVPPGLRYVLTVTTISIVASAVVVLDAHRSALTYGERFGSWSILIGMPLTLLFAGLVRWLYVEHSGSADVVVCVVLVAIMWYFFSAYDRLIVGASYATALALCGIVGRQSWQDDDAEM